MSMAVPWGTARNTSRQEAARSSGIRVRHYQSADVESLHERMHLIQTLPGFGPGRGPDQPHDARARPAAGPAPFPCTR